MGEYSKEQIVKVLEERGTIQVKDNEGMAYQISLRKDDAKVYVNYCEGDNNCFTYNGFIDWKYLVDNWGVHDCIVTYEVFKASLKEDGERDFSFYRNPSADMLLSEDEIHEEDFENGSILHFCSVSLIDAPIKQAHKKAIEYATKYNGIISFDPNVRLPLWESPEACRQAILEFLPLSNIVKISDEELEFITGIKDEQEALKSLFVGNVEVVIYTKGTNGSDFITKERKVTVPSFTVKAEDTTGAGDSYIGSFLYQVAQTVNTLEELVQLDEVKVTEIMTFSAATAALTVSKKGAIAALPTKEAVIEMMNR